MAEKLTLWRVCARDYASTAFNGEGAALHPGRWNGRGTRMVYLSECLSGATLEWFAYALNAKPGREYVYFEVSAPPEAVLELEPGSLPEDWNLYPHPVSTQEIGDEWVKSNASLLLRVPSVLVPESYNFLLNPQHPHFPQLSWSEPRALWLDGRLRRLVERARGQG
ncbi:MAG: RES family NAD+ phosphorylase [Meiothermus ruber]|jgi:RES domain-containing protein|uniref:RES family NAD+ phosphorylase n=1 Tax=Meiothermus ruber TaxID=277 RepID=UPI00391C7B0D